MQQIKDIFIGYTNLIKSWFGLFEPETKALRDKRKSICTSDCPLSGKFLGVGYCDPMKTYENKRGCGCIKEAKFWSDSPCPLGKF